MLRAFLSSCRKIRERTRLSGSHKETRKVGLWIRPCLEVLEDRTLLSTSSPGGLLQQIQQAETTFVQSFLTNINQMIQQFIRTEAAALAPWVKLLPSQPTVNVTIDGVPSDVSIGTTINLTSTVVEQHQLIPHQEIFSYAWSVTKDGAPYATGNQANFSFTPDSDDTYVVTLTATDMFGRTGTASASIDPLVSGGGNGGSGPGSGSKPKPGSVSVTITGVPSQVSLGTTISAGSNVTDSNPQAQRAGFTYSWTVTQAGGNGTVLASGNQANFSYTPNIVGNYVFSLTATDIYGHSGTAQQTVSVTGSASNLILMPPNELTYLRQQAANNTSQWQAFKAVLDQNLNVVLGSGYGSDNPATYEGSELAWIADYALGYQILKDSDPVTAAGYADKAIALIYSGLNDYQRGSWATLQYLTRTDGSTTTFTLPNSNIIPSSLKVYEAPIQTVAVTRGTSSTDTISAYQKIIKVSNTPDGNADYVEGTDWIHSGTIPNDEIGWVSGGKQPAAGQTYYITEASESSANPVTNYTLSGNTITFTTAPAAGQALFVQYAYNTPTQKYLQTSAGDGGYNNIYIDTNYSSRFLAYIPLGLDWLDGYANLSPTLLAQAENLLPAWSNYLTTQGFQTNIGPSNYSMGTYFYRAMTALYLEGRSTAAPQLMSDLLSWRQSILLPAIQDPGTGGMTGGFWPEGWSYGWIASQELLMSSLALEENGYIQATAEHAWASQLVRSLISAQPAPDQLYDGGEWFTYPARFLNPSMFWVLSAVADDPTAQAYANYILQNYPSSAYLGLGGDSNIYEQMLFATPSAPASFWSSEPLQYFNSGAGLLTARSDWGSKPTWVAVQMGNMQTIGHTTQTPGQVQIQRGDDDLLVNGNTPGDNPGHGANWSYMGNIVIVNAGSDQTYPGNTGFWYGTPGVVVTAQEGNNNFAYIAGDCTAAYNNAPGSTPANPVTGWTREVVYIRPDYVVVYDRVATLKDSYIKEQQWNFLNAPTVNGNTFVESVGSSKLFGATFSTTPLSLTVQATPAGSVTIQQLEIQNASPTLSVNYLTAFQVAPSTTASMDATAHVLTTDGRMEGTQIGNQLVLFGVTAGTVDLTTAVTYSLSGSSSVNNMLMDLKAGGVYQVVALGTNGINLSTQTVTADSQGVLSFATPTGTQQVMVTKIG